MIESIESVAEPSSGKTEFGLIGRGIGRSMAPMLHRELGRLTGRDVSYRLHDVAGLDQAGLGSLLSTLERRGVVGVNVTHPFKQVVVDLVAIDDPMVRAIGAVNTVRFDATGPVGFNTDHSGFQAAYRHRFTEDPGVVAQLGAGGFGRAAAFGLAALAVDRICLFDPDRDRGRALAADVEVATGTSISLHATAEDAVAGVDGIVNASPIGMSGHLGCPVNPDALHGPAWVFDAVYAPVDTEFLRHAAGAGAVVMPGSELFFWQGIHAFEIFHRTHLDPPIVDAAADIVRREVERRTIEGS